VKILVSIVIIIAGSFTWQAQDELSWKMMADIKYEQRLHPELEEELEYPIFSTQTLELKGKEVVVEGFAVRTSDSGLLSEIIITKDPIIWGSCSSLPKPHEAVQAFMKTPTAYTKEKISIKGRLALNLEDLDKLIYILEDAEVME